MEILLSRAMAGAVSRWPLTEVVRVRARVSPCGIFGGRNSDGTSFLRVLRLSLPISFHRVSPLSYIIWEMKNRPVRGHSLETVSPYLH
jgi:hypothetical protein